MDSCSTLIKVLTSPDISTLANVITAVCAIKALNMWKKQISAENQIAHIAEVRTKTIQALIDWVFHVDKSIRFAREFQELNVNLRLFDETTSLRAKEIDAGFDEQTKNIYSAKEFGTIFIIDDALRSEFVGQLQYLIDQNIKLKTNFLCKVNNQTETFTVDIQADKRMLHQLIKSLAPNHIKAM